MTERSAAVYRAGGAGVAWRVVGEEIVILDIASSVYFGLDPLGALLWQRLVGGATAEELAVALMAGAPVDRDRAAADVHDFLDALRHHGLIDAP